MKVGILGFQGSIEEHERVLHYLGVGTRRVRYVQDLLKVDALVFPGGESTTMGIFLEKSGLLGPLQEALKEGMPALATCAGLILLAREIKGRAFASLGILPVTVQRNAYGRQRESFTTELTLSFDPENPFPGVFIRAPQIVKVHSEDVQTLSSFQGQPIMVGYRRIIGCTFHPELTQDTRVHEYFLSLARP